MGKTMVEFFSLEIVASVWNTDRVVQHLEQNEQTLKCFPVFSPGFARRLDTWRYLSWRAAGDEEMMSEASFRARDAFCSPSAPITLEQQSIVKL